MAGLDARTARAIRRALQSGKRTQREIARRYRVSVSTVRRIARMNDREFEEYIKRKKAATRKRRRR